MLWPPLCVQFLYGTYSLTGYEPCQRQGSGYTADGPPGAKSNFARKRTTLSRGRWLRYRSVHIA